MHHNAAQSARSKLVQRMHACMNHFSTVEKVGLTVLVCVLQMHQVRNFQDFDPPLLATLWCQRAKCGLSFAIPIKQPATSHTFAICSHFCPLLQPPYAGTHAHCHAQSHTHMAAAAAVQWPPHSWCVRQASCCGAKYRECRGQRA
jgi:hypothetical protein